MELKTYMFKYTIIKSCVCCPFSLSDDDGLLYCYLQDRVMHSLLAIDLSCPLKEINIRSINENKIEALINN